LQNQSNKMNIKVEITITFTKLIASCTLLAGTILSYHTLDNAYFLASCGVSTTIITTQNMGQSYVKSKCISNENETSDFSAYSDRAVL